MFRYYSSCALFMENESCPPDARAAATPTAHYIHKQCQSTSFVSLSVSLLQRGGERASCSVKPSSTVLLDCPICLSINTHTNTPIH